MRLSWNEIRARASAFASTWSDAAYEKGESQSFYNDFFEVFGVQRRRVAVFEARVGRLAASSGFIDLFWPGVLLVEQKSAGRNLANAKAQAEDYCLGLKPREHPRFILVSDFQNFELYDLEEGEELKFKLEALHEHVERFGFILGVERRTFRDQDPVNIEASELVGKLHDALQSSGYVGHDLEQFLVRIVFCLFADDTGIFESRDMFLEFLEARTSVDGADLGGWLSSLFQVLDTPENERSAKLDEDLARFPYINGDLFNSPLRIPSFDQEMRQRLIDACLFDWSAISPAIFGSLFQSVMNREERRHRGAHYTTERNILKVIEPLFLDQLRGKFDRIRARKDGRRRSELWKFQQHLAGLKFLDPACGCGNFLIIAYRELRQLEIEVLKERKAYLDDERTLEIDASHLSIVNVDQFFGIEIGEFPARIAETAMWMMDHIMNNRLSLEFGRSYVRIPLRRAPHIRNRDALEFNWSDLLPADQCSFVFGNPPFVGSKYQTPEQREQVQRIADLAGSRGTLDYVAGWFITAGHYCRAGAASIGFVSTNSITQGEQVAQLWPILFSRCGLEIAFAHRTFAWGSDAARQAHVHVVVIGLVPREREIRRKKLFSYDSQSDDPTETTHGAISPYLFDADGLRDRHLVVSTSPQPLNGLPQLIIGSKPVDGSNYVFNLEERERFLAAEPGGDVLMHPYVGAREFLNGGKRWILALQDADPSLLQVLPKVQERVARVRAFRLGRSSRPTQALAETPTNYHVNVIPSGPFLVIPKTTSQRRTYLPIGWMAPPTIPSDLVFVLTDATKPIFAMLTSAMHMAWLRHIGGRLKSDYRYSIGLVYNNFPFPPTVDTEQLGPYADAVLDTRSRFPDATLAALYDPNTMPAPLKKAHLALDRAVDRLYRKTAFSSERERVEHLFGLYENLVSPLVQTARGRRRRV